MATIHIIRMLHSSQPNHEAIAVSLGPDIRNMSMAVAQSSARLPIEKTRQEFDDLVHAIKLLWCNESDYTEGGYKNWHFTYKKVVR